MKALAIVALIFASLAIFIPVGGVVIAVICSVMALISFRSQSTLSGITFGINIINTALLSPTLFSDDAVLMSRGSPSDVYFTFVGIHIFLLAVAIIWKAIKGPVNQAV